jgi:hypothetical protein
LVSTAPRFVLLGSALLFLLLKIALLLRRRRFLARGKAWLTPQHQSRHRAYAYCHGKGHERYQSVH